MGKKLVPVEVPPPAPTPPKQSGAKPPPLGHFYAVVPMDNGVGYCVVECSLELDDPRVKLASAGRLPRGAAFEQFLLLTKRAFLAPAAYRPRTGGEGGAA